MDMAQIDEVIKKFSSGQHGNSDYYKDKVFVVGEDDVSICPLSYLEKKIDGFSVNALQSQGFVEDSFELHTPKDFPGWYERVFSRKLKKFYKKGLTALYRPNNRAIFDAIETVNKMYEILRNENIILNGKKLPVQLGEWYAKTIFGLRQVKSSSQRGFDFFIDDKRVEVKVHWGDHSSPKGVKVRKSLVQLSEYSIIVYVAKNLMIREVCFLDSDYILRKFSGKGHTIFLKDPDIKTYFFSNSSKHSDKVKNKMALMKYSNPTLAMKLDDLLN